MKILRCFAYVGLLALLAVSANAQDTSALKTVAGLGFVEPEGGVTTVAGGQAVNQGIVSELNVKVGDKVKRNDVIAKLGDNALLQAALQQAESQLLVRRAQLRRAQAGASQAELNAQVSIVERLRTEVSQAEVECARQRSLYKRKITSYSAFLQQCDREEVLRHRLSEAESTLTAISTIRPEDIEISQAEVDGAEINVRYAKVALEGSFVRAPIDGTILQIHATEGERIGAAGLLDMGFVQRMWVSVEIYESDIRKVRVGQAAKIIAQGIDDNIKGTVQSIGLTVERNEVLSTNPTADVDARVVRVKVQVDEADSQKLAALTNLQVSVIIQN